MTNDTHSRAKVDLAHYNHAMRSGFPLVGLAIEQRWNIDGLPPQQVAQFLSDVAAGATPEEAMHDLTR